MGGLHVVDWSTRTVRDSRLVSSDEWHLECYAVHTLVVYDCFRRRLQCAAGGVLLLSRRVYRRHMTAWRAGPILLTAVSGYKWRSSAVSPAGAASQLSGQSDRSRHRMQLSDASKHAINKNGRKSRKREINFLTEHAYIQA